MHQPAFKHELGLHILVATGKETRLVTEAGSLYLNVEPLPREHRDPPTEEDTEPTIYRSQPCDTRSGLRAGKIKGVVTFYNKTIKISCFILSYHSVIKYIVNCLTKARSHNVYYLLFKLPV